MDQVRAMPGSRARPGPDISFIRMTKNSMGFHNPSEISTELHNALALAQSAKQNAEDALGAPCVPTEPTEVTCDDGLDNDCDGTADCDDDECTGDVLCLPVDCTLVTEEAVCRDEPNCRWRKNQQDCVNR